MTTPNDGGPAFPVPLTFNPHDGSPQNTGMYWDGNGMSLRDWFAGQALTGMLASGKDWDGSTEARIALAAYAFADAMLKERAAQ